MTTTVFVLLGVALFALPISGSSHRLLRLRPEAASRTKAVVAVDDPMAVASTFDILAACLRAGLPMASAAGAVAGCAPQPLASSLRRAADLLTLGADPAAAWSEATDPETQALARMARRSARAGSSLALGMAELAGQRRAAAEDAAAARAERAGVLISGPLGLCFLPAFICLGIVPVVVGLARHLLGLGLF